MALCENFDCKLRTYCGASAGCERSCLVALDIYKCDACKNRSSCMKETPERYERVQHLKRLQLSAEMARRNRKK